jgi:hypothetical protein
MASRAQTIWDIAAYGSGIVGSVNKSDNDQYLHGVARQWRHGATIA